MNKITVYCELDFNTKELSKVSYELISKANSLKKECYKLNNENVLVEGIVLGSNINRTAIDNSKKYGLDRLIFFKENSLSSFNQIIYSEVLLEYIKNNPTDVILFPASFTGRILAPRVTTKLDTGLVADCTKLEIILKDNKTMLAATRPTFGSELMAAILFKKNPQCATLRANVFKKEENNSENFQYIEQKPTPYSEFRLKLIKSLKIENSSTDLFKNSKVVLVAGMGINSLDKSYFSKLRNLAKKLNAAFGATRNVVNYSQASLNEQIGQTGATIEADLYIGFGVRGALQHTCGIKNCKTIIGINTDENAEIFKYCDYKIVADAKEIIDELIILTSN